MWRRISILSIALLTASGSARGSDRAPSTTRLDDRSPYYSLRSERSVGDRGEVSLEVSLPRPGCGEQWRFQRAEIEFVRNRFGDAQFVALPERGCVQCAPVTVRWMHEPTGRLEFNVYVYREWHFVPCEKES